MVISQHWLDIQAGKRYKISSEEHTTGPTWSLIHTTSFSDASLGGDLKCHKSTKNGCNFVLQIEALEFVAADSLEPLVKTKQGNSFIIAMTSCYSKLTRAIPLPRTKASHVAMVVPDNWILPYGISNTIVTGNGLQFVSKFSAALFASVGTKLITATEYYPQANSQVERFDKKLVARLRNYIGEHQTGWDIHVQRLACGYNTQVHRTTKTFSFRLVLRRKLSEAL